MSEVLSFEEYQSIANSLTLPTTAFIDGRFQPSLSGKQFPTINPATGETLAEIAACDQDDVDLCVQKAREAFDDGRWSKLHPTQRKQTLIQLAKLIKRNSVPYIYKVIDLNDV